MQWDKTFHKKAMKTRYRKHTLAEYINAMNISATCHSSGAVLESRWPSWAVRPNEPSGFRGRKAILNHASALVSACP